MNIQQALNTSTKKLKQKNIPSASLDAEVLLLEALNRCRCEKLNHKNASDIKHGIAAFRYRSIRNDNESLDKSWLYAHSDYKLNKDEEKLFNNFISQREKYKPVAYIINRKEFYGYDLYVNENVLIPRPETELIVDEVLKILNKQTENKFYPALAEGHSGFSRLSKKITLIDIGTGSGCIIISVLNKLTKNKFINNAFANDISKKAIEVAKINAKKYNLDQKIKFITGDLEKAISEKIFSNSDQIIITANLPYIKNDDYKTLRPNVRKYEPAIALKAGKDGLDYIRKLIDLISKTQLKLNKNIYLLLEADPDQINKITAILSEKFTNPNIKIIKDLSDKERIISAKL